MSSPEATYHEATAEARLQSLPLSQLSIEVGHLYFEDFDGGPDRLRRHFEGVAPWVAAALDVHRREFPQAQRVSTCFLVDDFFGPSRPPADILPALLGAAAEAGVPIDYVARESACADADGVPLAQAVLEQIVADPTPGTNGSRPPPRDIGWLSNGQRSMIQQQAEAMSVVEAWTPPRQNAANRHSVFVDVQLWDTPRQGRRWSCAFLASVWQLLRLGLLRYAGEPVAQPRDWPDEAYPDEWRRLPPVLRVNPQAAPFSAYRSLSILGGRFLPTELAVRTILSQVAINPDLVAEVGRRAGREGSELPAATVDRMRYVFIG